MGNKSMCGAPLWQSISLVQLIVGKTWFPLKKFDTDTDRSTVLNIRSPVGKIGMLSKNTLLQTAFSATLGLWWHYGDKIPVASDALNKLANLRTTYFRRFSVVLDWLYQK